MIAQWTKMPLVMSKVHTRVLIRLLAPLLLIQLPANGLGRQQRTAEVLEPLLMPTGRGSSKNSSTWTSATHVSSLAGVVSVWLGLP